jgi:transcriptional regulator GlxA family with amidase domain
MLHDVAVAACDRVAAFELGVVCEVFGLDRTADGLPGYDFAVCAAEPPPLTTTSGFSIDTRHGVERLAQADLICVPAWRDVDERPPQALLDALRHAVSRGARVMSVCSGAFVLAWAGLLDDRRATTHWRHVEELATRFPRVHVLPDALYVDEGAVLTSAGTAAGIDLCLHIVRKEHGAEVANAVARRMVIPAHRDGGQAQYIETPIPAAWRPGGLAGVLAWAQSHLHENLTIDRLAARAHMSRRTFSRRFGETTGSTPHRWLLGQRIDLARQLLESTDMGVDEVAGRSGFGTGTSLRTHFARRLGTTPGRYRRTFRQPTAGAPHGEQPGL